MKKVHTFIRKSNNIKLVAKMTSKMTSPQILYWLLIPFLVLIFFQDIGGIDARKIEVNVFFNVNDLKPNNRIQIYFPIKSQPSKPPLLSREEADSIPFSTSQLPYILHFFSFSIDSPQAKALEESLKHCEFEHVQGETKFCATSLESMLDSSISLLSSNNLNSQQKIKVFTTNHLTKTTSSIYQNYTVTGRPEEIIASKMVACHALSYPYAVFYCHSQMSDNKLYKVLLVGDDGGKVDAIAICHMDTSMWDPSHVAFQVLKTKPGKSPVCHFFPEDNLVWVAVS